MEVELIDISRIVEDPDQPRRRHDGDALQGLADSLRQHGMLNPITVCPLANVGMYRIVTGERRWRAAASVGMDRIPCIVKAVDGDDVLTEQLVENLQREDLAPLEKAKAIGVVKNRLSATNREVGARLGLSERTVGYLLDLLELPEEIGSEVVVSPNRPADGQLTEKHARYLRALGDQPNLQSRVVDKVRAERLSGDQTGKLVKALRGSPEFTDEILTAPASDFIGYVKSKEEAAAVRAAEAHREDAEAGTTCAAAVRAMDFLASLDAVHPVDMSRPAIRQLQDALTSLRMAVDALLRECRLELGESP